MTYYSTEEDFHRYLVPALLSMSSVKTASVQQEYLNEQYKYSVSLVKPFEVIQPTEGEIGSFIALQDTKAGYIQVVKEELSRKLSAQEYAKLVEKNSLVNLSEYKELSNGKNLIQGNEFYWRIFQFSSKGFSYRCLQTYVLLDNIAYTLTYMAKTQEFDQFVFPAIYTVFSFKKR